MTINYAPPSAQDLLTLGFVATSGTPAYVNVRYIVSMYEAHPTPPIPASGGSRAMPGSDHTGMVETVQGSRAIYRPWNLFLAEVLLALSHIRLMR